MGKKMKTYLLVRHSDGETVAEFKAEEDSADCIEELSNLDCKGVYGLVVLET